MSEKLLEVKHLSTSFFTHVGEVKAIRDISFAVDRGEFVGIVGESGSGKSVTSLSILRLLQYPGKVTGGEILLNGEDLLKKDKREMRKIRGNQISMCFQDPMTALNPLYTIGNQINEVILEHQKLTKAEATKKTIEMLGMVGIPDPEARVKCYPYEFSGGMRQRALLAQAMLGDPPLLILDEPTSGVDPQERIRIRGLIARATQNHIVLLATHVVSDVECIANQVLLMNSGTLLKSGTPEELIASIETKVAQRFCTPEEIELYQHQHSVSLLFQRQGGQLLRLVGDDLPAEFEPAAGIGLEEVYLYYCAGNKAINT